MVAVEINAKSWCPLFTANFPVTPLKTEDCSAILCTKIYTYWAISRPCNVLSFRPHRTHRINAAYCCMRVVCFLDCMYRVGQKVRPETHGYNSVKYWPIFNFFTGRFPGKFAVKPLLEIPPQLARVDTLPRETLASENKRLTIDYEVV